MNKSISLLISLSVLFIVGCNATPEPIATTLPAQTKDTENSTATVNPIPSICPNKTAVIVKSAEIGTVEIAADNSWYVEDSSHWGGFYLTNYESTLEDITNGHSHVGSEVTVNFGIRTEDKTPIKIGEWDHDYSKANKNNLLLGFTVYHANGRLDPIGFNQKVTITYFGDDYVCGNISVDDGDSKISILGDFVAIRNK